MILRAATLVGSVASAGLLSQFPEYSQQYMQRLGGAVDELARQVDRYEADAARFGIPLQQYISELADEGEKAKTQAANMRDDLTRHANLSAALEALEGAGPFMRAKLATHMGDRDVAGRALENFKPAIPATFEGAAFAGTGFLGGWALIALIVGFVRRLWFTLLGVVRRAPA